MTKRNTKTAAKFLDDDSAGAVRLPALTKRNGAMFPTSLVRSREEDANDMRNAKTIDQMFSSASAVRIHF